MYAPCVGKLAVGYLAFRLCFLGCTKATSPTGIESSVRNALLFMCMFNHLTLMSEPLNVDFFQGKAH